jgi:hypothetical protein
VQVVNEQREYIAELRLENSKLVMEVMELKNMADLNEEQVRGNSMASFTTTSIIAISIVVVTMYYYFYSFVLFDTYPYLLCLAQLAALKETVKELQSSLVREEEFNSSGHRVNAEYLVNVLRKFLMSDSASERVHLVGVITQLLHMKAEECKTIADKWAVKSGGGLVGWLLPRAPSGSAGRSSSSGGAVVDGLGGLDVYT